MTNRGAISAWPREHVGTALPAGQAVDLTTDDEALNPNAELRAIESPRARVLVIDDDKEIRLLVADVLSEAGYEVVLIEHISDARIASAIDDTEPDCILLDGAQASGYEDSWATAASMRDRPTSIPTVMFTAHAQDALEALEGRTARAANAGFSAVVSKPFLIEELVKAVARAVTSRSTR